ncbi:MAG: hypothetical protein COA38_02460 [Fluviicola sp.]|nr:MAG: hypothetical protein COA38_02460 [Fluviicola sp.]
MKNYLLLFAVTLICSAPLFAQQDVEKVAANFKFNWNEYLLPECSFLIYHGSDESYFIDSLGERVPNHSYLDIKTGGKHHFIVQDKSGFHILDTNLTFVTKKAYDNIELNFGLEIELSSKEITSYYTWLSETKSYGFTDISQPPPPWAMAQKREYNLELGKVNDARFKAKRIEKLRIGIDMSQTLSIGQKGKNVLVKKDGLVVYKGPSKPMLFYDFMITGSKAPHSVYHPISKKPILENCERFWCVGSFLVVSIKGTSQKHILSNSGEVILSSVGEIRYYDYEFGGERYSFFCDGRSVINTNGDKIYRSDGELIGIGEHYIYSGHSGGYLGDLSHEVKMNCTNFCRIGELTVGQIGRNKWRLFDPKSILINQFDDYFFDETDSLLICTDEAKTAIFNPYNGNIGEVYPVEVRAKQTRHEAEWKYYSISKSKEDVHLEGRFEPKEGILIEPKYRKIEWPKSINYYIVITQSGLIRYLDSEGHELFD